VKRFARQAIILLYHRVAEVDCDPQLLCVTPQHFAEHLEVLSRYHHPLSLETLRRRQSVNPWGSRGVAVTFDDGYADNLRNAKPLLERYDMPATVFVTAGYVEADGREFWWDELERLLLHPGILPKTLRLSHIRGLDQCELGEAYHYSEDAYRRHRGWNLLEKDDPGPRQRLYRFLCQSLRPLSERERREALDELLAWAGAEPLGRPIHRALSPDEVFRFAEGGLIEIGAHTVSHSVLSAIPATAQRDEIQKSKAYLERILGRQVTGFSYPYGARTDYTRETVAIVRESGFAYACSNFADLVWRGTDCFQLPRFLVRDWDGDSFTRWIRRAFNA
jgi:peptidoglycan/xylan/chitin deacetylase (PgdA/CDA1 family)